MPLRHFTEVSDLSRPELDAVLDNAFAMSSHRRAGRMPSDAPSPLSRRAVAFVSSKESLRTKGSIKQAAVNIGGDMEYFGKDSLFDEKGKTRESMEDIVGSLEAMGFPIVFLRLHKHEMIRQLLQGKRTASIVNALTDESHPLQALSDAEALMLARPGVMKHKVVFTGDGNNVAASLGEVSAMLGWDFVHTGPRDRQIRPERWKNIERLAKEHGGSAEYMMSLYSAVEGATMVYTDVFASMGEKGDAAKLNALMAPYKVTEDVMRCAGPQALFGHCMPAERGVEVDADVFDGPQSIALPIAGCRTDTAAAIMQFLLEKR